jgi:hypothetical protein
MAGDVVVVAPRESAESRSPGSESTETAPVPPSEQPPASGARAFLLWGGAGYLVATFGVLLQALGRTEGRLVYVIDDPAIHLSVARNLAEHGTWGVVPGHFESASSSPVWTVLLAGWLRLVPGPDSAAPLALNVLASLGVIAVFGWAQHALRPALRRPLDVVATVVLVTVVLFLPGLTFTGMEHTLHILLLVATVALFHRRAGGRPVPGPGWLPYALLAAATLTRFETGFVAVGIALAMLVTEPGPRLWPPTLARWRRPLAVVAVPAVAFAGFAVVNRLMGQGLLPNSVLAKGPKTSAGPALLETAFNRFGSDQLVALLTGVAVVAVVAFGRRNPAWSFPAVVVAVAVPLHMLFAQVGWYERYQAYLVALGVYLVLCLLAELPVTGPAAVPRWAAPVLACLLVLFAGNKPAGVVRAGDAMTDTYEQRYQAALFLQRYYDGEPVATGELGYISLFHRGPITDVFGLGDHEVLQEWQRVDDRPGPDFWEALVEQRGADVVVVYPLTLYRNVPDSWISVGTIGVDRFVTTAPGPSLTVYATRPEAVDRLHDNLEDFRDDLPSGSRITLNPLAEMKASSLIEEAAGSDAP